MKTASKLYLARGTLSLSTALAVAVVILAPLVITLAARHPMMAFIAGLAIVSSILGKLSYLLDVADGATKKHRDK